MPGTPPTEPQEESQRPEAAELEAGSYWVEPAQLRAFLLATIARCASGSLLRFLSNDLLVMIAKCNAHRARSRLIFTHTAAENPHDYIGRTLQDGRVFACYGDAHVFRPTIALPTARTIEYFVVDVDDLWCGSTFVIQPGDLRLTFTVGEEDQHIVTLSDGDADRHVTVWSWENQSCPSKPPLACACTFGTCSRFRFGVLCDLVRGTVRWVLNNVPGPRIKLGAGWEQGVRLELGGDFPDEGPRVNPGDWDCWQARIIQPSRVPPFLHTSDDGHDAFCEGCLMCEEEAEHDEEEAAQ